MEITVSGRHTTVSESLRRQAEDKIGRLDKFLGMDRAEVHFWEEKNSGTNREFCEVTMEGHGHHVRCKVNAPDGFTAIDLAVDKLERQLRKLKTKLHGRHKGGQRSKGRSRPELEPELVPDSLLPVDEEPEPVYKIVKTKRFEVGTMDSQEAALQMDLLNHDFFVFRNSETEQAAVVYRRSDGDIGLIETS